jgi:hypothetical protein
MAWMTVAFLPWMIFWITFNIPVSPLISVGVPLCLSLLLVGYRAVFNKPTWMEIGGAGFFAAAGILTLLNNIQFALWGVTISQGVMGLLWFGSLLFSDMPLCGEYSKWGYIPGVWQASLFIHPNAAITLVWGWLYVLLMIWGVGAELFAGWGTVLSVSRYLLLIPGFIFTSIYPKNAGNRQFANIDKALQQMRFLAGVGAAFTAVIIGVIWFGL